MKKLWILLILSLSLVLEEAIAKSSLEEIIKVNRRGKNRFREADIRTEIIRISNAPIDPSLNKLWPDGEVHYFLESSITDKNKIREALKAIEEKVSCVKFKELSSSDEVEDYISVIQGNGCWSYIGKNGGEQQLSIGRGCEFDHIIQHEFYHALGFYHEQSRPDRDSNVRIFEENIMSGRESNFRIVNDVKTTTDYDFKSIMHYGNKAFSNNGQDTIQRIGNPSFELGGKTLTPLDIEGLKTLYGCSGVITPPPPTLPPTGGEYIFCKSGRRGNLRCPSGQSIDVTSAKFGVSESVEACLEDLFSKDCSKSDILSNIISECNGKNRCRLKGRFIAKFGDRKICKSKGEEKFLQVVFKCQ